MFNYKVVLHSTPLLQIQFQLRIYHKLPFHYLSEILEVLLVGKIHFKQINDLNFNAN